jgi:uncharacterized RDD family membrane protein YckC
MSEPIGTQYGGFWIRFLALLVDSAILFVVAAALLGGAVMALGAEGITPAAFGVWLLCLLYWPVMHASARQGTFGKSILGLKVARVNGGRISIVRAIGRELAKILSATVLMVGYLMAGFTGRKQALHDLMASTYVMREGPARVIPALVLAVAGFAAPVVLVPMLLGGAAISMMTNMAEGMITQQDAMKQAPLPRTPVAVKARPKPAAPAAPAPVAVAKLPAAPVAAAAPAPAPAVPAPAPAAAVPAPAPAPAAPVAVAKPEPIATPKPKLAEAPKRKPAPERKPAPVRIAAAPTPTPPSTLPAFQPKLGEGPRFNDLMTAVLYRDSEGVSELLRLGKWPDKPDSNGLTPLMTAVELGDVRSAEVLLRGGANPNVAVSVAERRGDAGMVDLLRRYGGR